MYSKYYSNYMDFLVCFFNYETNVGIVSFYISEYNKINYFRDLNKDYIYIISKYK